MESHTNKDLEEHWEKIKEEITKSSFGDVNQDKYEDLLESTPFSNKVWSGDQILDTLFTTASEKMKDDDDKEILEKLRNLVKIYEHEMKDPRPKYQQALFFPNKKNLKTLCEYIMLAKHKLRICMFTFTNHKICKAVMDRYNAGVEIFIITDDECMKQRGSDIEYLASQGIPIRTDNSVQYHMHDKFVVIDNDIVITGSFNWTVQAAENNQENILITDRPYFVFEYKEEFKRLWSEFAENEVEAQAFVEKGGKRKFIRKKAVWNN